MGFILFTFPKKCPKCGAEYTYSDGKSMVIELILSGSGLLAKSIRCSNCLFEMPVEEEISEY